jgi:hypothetical protein
MCKLKEIPASPEAMALERGTDAAREGQAASALPETHSDCAGVTQPSKLETARFPSAMQELRDAREQRFAPFAISRSVVGSTLTRKAQSVLVSSS